MCLDKHTSGARMVLDRSSVGGMIVQSKCLAVKSSTSADSFRVTVF
jgi:hypothetical protein